MAKAKIIAGNCGFSADVEAVKVEGERYKVKVTVESDCKSIQKMAADLDVVDAFNEISQRRGTPEILEKGAKYCAHASCPIPVGIIKAVEVEAGMALPKDVTITIEK